MNKRKYRALVLIYALVGVLWIVGSDWLLGHLIGDLTTSFNISIAKGIGFILIMSILLYALLMKLDATEKKAVVAENVDQLFLNKIPVFFQSISLVTYAIEEHERHTQFIWVSDNVARMLGYPTNKVFEPNWWHSCLHPHDKLRAIETVRHMISHGGGDQYYRFKHADGSYIYIHDELRAVENTSPPRFVGAWHDVSGEEHAQQQILDYSTRLEKTFLGTIYSISSMVEMRDPYTAGHESRVGDIAAKIAEEMGLDNDRRAIRFTNCWFGT
ncbi:PAS domain-containing protein [Cellvibrio sp. UBA7661]|uniref:PAS domain-containing protein n=1 Tax=Cellvibrio sp. UBA7661 TaxID=1946311 RepID=UPI002F35FA12